MPAEWGVTTPTSRRRFLQISGDKTSAQLGFSTAIVPAKSPEVDANIKLVRVNTVREAMKALGLTGKVPKRTDDF